MCSRSNTTGATCGTGTAFPYRAADVAPVFNGLSDARVVHVVKLHVFTFMFPGGDVQCDFKIKTMYDSS